MALTPIRDETVQAVIRQRNAALDAAALLEVQVLRLSQELDQANSRLSQLMAQRPGASAPPDEA